MVVVAASLQANHGDYHWRWGLRFRRAGASCRLSPAWRFSSTLRPLSASSWGKA